MTELTGIFKQIEERSFTASYCFLCGVELNSENKTIEHVIPKWIQNRFNLWDQKITLINGTTFPYRNLTIPCCFECNNKYLKPFETIVLKAFEKGFDVFSSLDREVLFLWLGKIYYGIMYKELFLSNDRKNPNSQNINTPEYLDSFFTHFLFLQGIRSKHKFNGFFPASIYFFKTQKIDDIEKEWDFIDSHFTLFIAIRMGEIGLISVLQDGQATQQMEEHLERHKEIELHPLQFRELTAKILYKAMLMNRTPKYMNSQVEDVVETFQMPLQGLSSKPIFDDWDNDVYARILSELTGVPLEQTQPEQGKVWTWLHDENDEPLFMDVKKYN